MAGQQEIDTAIELFKAWSSGDADAPGPFFAEECILRDIVAGEDKVGWPAIREFFAGGLEGAPDLALIPEKFWTADDGVAFTWRMSATVTHEAFGAEHKGKKWYSDGMDLPGVRRRGQGDAGGGLPPRRGHAALAGGPVVRLRSAPVSR